MRYEVTEHIAKTPRHATHYLSCGGDDAPLIVFVHGWPELSISWRHQLRCFAELGFRAVAPDMRGYGKSTVHPATVDYAVEHIVESVQRLRAMSPLWEMAQEGIDIKSIKWAEH